MPRSNGNEDSPAIDVDLERQRSLSDAVSNAISNVSTRISFDKRRRKTFIELLASGLSISAAAHQVGISATHIHRVRREDPLFDEAVTSAIELGTDPVADRMVAIALHGNPESMATVSAAKLVLQGRNVAYRDRGGSVRMEKRDPDGTTYRISASANGVPD